MNAGTCKVQPTHDHTQIRFLKPTIISSRVAGPLCVLVGMASSRGTGEASLEAGTAMDWNA
jgi:hypothetical protein